MAASAYPSAPNVTLSERTPSARRTRGSGQTIQSDRGPVSPSGMRRTRSPIAAAIARKTASALASGTLPTRCTPWARGWATVVMPIHRRGRASAESHAGSSGRPRDAGHVSEGLGLLTNLVDRDGRDSITVVNASGPPDPVPAVAQDRNDLPFDVLLALAEHDYIPGSRLRRGRWLRLGHDRRPSGRL